MKAILAVLAGAALLGAGAAPAAAASTPFGTLACFSGASLGATGTARGEKDTSAIVAETEIPAGQEPSTANFGATVPVWFHVVARDRSRSGGWVSDSMVHEQMRVLNAAFAGSGTGFHFALQGITRTINADWYALQTFQDEIDMKTALKRGDATTLNIYSVDFMLGFAYYPKIVAGNPYQVLDGIVIHPESMPGGKIKNFNLGHTATHEAGHWLGLAHTFDGGCYGDGDRVDDTPAMSVPTGGCPEGKDTCVKEAGLDPIHNYMDYSDDPCYNQFTAGQTQRMQDAWLHFRASG